MSTTTPNTPVIVVTEERRRRRGLIWLVCAVALCATVMGGSTFALWSANGRVAGKTVTAGDLNLTGTSPKALFYDVSADRLDGDTWAIPSTPLTGHIINYTDEWRMVPGDRVAGSFSTYVTLEGDNLVADLSASGLESLHTGDNQWLDWTYELYLDGNLVVSESPVPTTANATMLRLAATEDGQATGRPDATPDVTLPIGGDAVADTVISLDQFNQGQHRGRVTFVFYATFSGTAADGSAGGSRAGALAESTLQDIELTLLQVRTGPNFTRGGTETL